MSELLGFAISLLLTFIAGVVSGLRLKPYLDAGEVYTPPTFALYPALVATGFSVVVVLVLCKWRGKPRVNVGPVSFTGKQLFAFLWCLFYVIVALMFFPYQLPLAPLGRQPLTKVASQDLLGTAKFHHALLRNWQEERN